VTQITMQSARQPCRRLTASGGLPDRATQIVLHMDLDRLRGLPGAADTEAAYPGPIAPPGAECDATIVPVVTGHVDHVVLDRLAAALMRGGWTPAAGGASLTGTALTGAGLPGASLTGPGDQAETARRELSAQAARRIILAAAADVLSGPAGLAAYLRTGVLGASAAISLPLDTGTATDGIPAHLRRLVILRDRHCRWPGCHQPPAPCHPHHLRPRRKGGQTTLANLALLCVFNHLIAVHRWGWQIVLNPDGTVTVTSPDGHRVRHSHSPPTQAA
jgi:hypothetical protein